MFLFQNNRMADIYSIKKKSPPSGDSGEVILIKHDILR